MIWAASAVIAAWTMAALALPRNVKLGDSIEPVKLRDLEGNAIDTTSWRGAPSVWIFVAAGQSSSEKALIGLQAALDALIGSNIRVIALTTDAVQAPYFRELRSRSNVRIPVAIDAGREVYGRIGVIVLPTTLLIDKDGKLARVVSGYEMDYANSVQTQLAFLAGRITADERDRRLVTTQPQRDAAREQAERLCRSAEIMIQRGLSAEAAAELQRAISADPSSGTAYLRLARLKADAGDLAGAEKLVQLVQTREPKNHHAQLVLGMIRFRQGRLDDAEKLLDEAIILNPDPARANYWLGRVYQSKNQADKAAACFRAAAEALSPDLAESPARSKTR